MFYVQLIVTILGVSTIFSLITAAILLGMQAIIENLMSLNLNSQHQIYEPSVYRDKNT